MFPLQLHHLMFLMRALSPNPPQHLGKIPIQTSFAAPNSDKQKKDQPCSYHQCWSLLMSSQKSLEFPLKHIMSSRRSNRKERRCLCMFLLKLQLMKLKKLVYRMPIFVLLFPFIVSFKDPVLDSYFIEIPSF